MTNPKPRPAPKRINDSTHGHLSGEQMRERTAAERHVAQTEKVVAEWIAYREATPIAAETFMSPSLVAALNELAEEGS